MSRHNRTKERERFLSDIITAAVEGGTGYWAQVSQYQWVDTDGTIKVTVGRQNGLGARATLHELDEGIDTYVKEGREISVDTIAHGIRAIMNPDFEINKRLKDTIAAADRQNEAGDIDAEAADVIVQAAIFGEIKYG